MYRFCPILQCLLLNVEDMSASFSFLHAHYLSVPEVSNADVKVRNSDVPSLELEKYPEIDIEEPLLELLFLQKAGWHFFKHSHLLFSSSFKSSTRNITPENEQQMDLMYHMSSMMEQTWPLWTAGISCWDQNTEFSLLQPAQACPKWICARGSLLSARDGWMVWRPVFHFELRSGTSNSKHIFHHSPWGGAQIPIPHTHFCSQRPLTSQAC